jgi:hypothetical protein
MTHPPPQLRGPALQEIDDPRRPHRDRKAADGTARVKSTTDSFLYSRHRTTPSAQLLSFCLLSTLEIIVGELGLQLGFDRFRLSKIRYDRLRPGLYAAIVRLRLSTGAGRNTMAIDAGGIQIAVALTAACRTPVANLGIRTRPRFTTRRRCGGHEKRILKALLVDGEASFSTQGTIKDGHPVSTTFTSKIVSNTETSDVTMVLDEGNVKELAAAPPPSSDRVPVANYNRHGIVGRLKHPCAPIRCMSSEHFGQLAWQFKRVSGSSGLKVQAAIAC